jgi:hypothetical protein
MHASIRISDASNTPRAEVGDGVCESIPPVYGCHSGYQDAAEDLGDHEHGENHAESLMLSTFAGALGWCFAQVSAPLLIAMLSERARPVRFALAMDTRILLFPAAVSTFAAVFFGLLPAEVRKYYVPDLIQ